MEYALADFLVDLGFTALTMSYEKRTRVLKRGLPLAYSSRRNGKLCVLSLASCNFLSGPVSAGDLVKLCVITSLVPYRRGNKFDPLPLIKSLLLGPLPPRSFELPKSCRECPPVSQSVFLPAWPPFIKRFFTPVSPQRSSRYTCSS